MKSHLKLVRSTEQAEPDEEWEQYQKERLLIGFLKALLQEQISIFSKQEPLHGSE